MPGDPGPEPSGSTAQKRPVHTTESQDDPTATKRAKVATEPAYKQSAKFWYPDGNIIIVVGIVGFRLFLSRLKLYCKLFAREILEPRVNPDAAQSDGSRSPDDSHKSSHHEYTLSDVDPVDFATFLQVLETPLQYALASDSPDQSACISLLRVATRVECDIVLKVAAERLRALWPLTPPRVICKKPHLDAIHAIKAARKHHITEVLRSAFYELLRNPRFWDKLSTRRKSISLPDSDIISLQNARMALMRKWTALLFTPPNAEGGSCLTIGRGTKKCHYTEEEERARVWRSEFVHQRHLEECSEDPIYYIDAMVQGREFAALEGAWCAACVEERKVAWLDARLEWWRSLDALFKIEYPK
ncbi:hypothetical protein FKP32DRAFT_1586285 [Trametes sanguinea]|nr:hypothetical protein FKP32DRAFT_1586285 [Trametes sanguinea]